jgi:hypothetical protein
LWIKTLSKGRRIMLVKRHMAYSENKHGMQLRNKDEHMEASKVWRKAGLYMYAKGGGGLANLE